MTIIPTSFINLFNFLSALQYFPDRFVRREIQNLPVVCSHSNRGCDWEGKFSEFEVSDSFLSLPLGRVKHSDML